MATTTKKPAKTEEPELPAFLRRTKDKVAIVGFAESWQLTPFDDQSFEIWGINRLHVVASDKRWDRYFQLHDIEEHHPNDEDHLKWLRSLRVPVYLRPADIGKYDIPSEVPFPVEEMVRVFGTYFTNTISWLMAFAIWLEFKEMAVFGVDMATDGVIEGEYAYQRPSCEYFLGLAAGQGISVTIPASSDLLKSTHLYGFESGGVLREKYIARMKELSDRKNRLTQQLAGLDQQRAQMVANINQLDGAGQDVQYWLRNWSQSPNGPGPDVTIGTTTGD